MKKILILGGGFAGVYAFLKLHKYFHPSINSGQAAITMINNNDYFLFTPLLHEVATGGVSQENVVYPIRALVRCCLNFIKADVGHIDFNQKIAHSSAGSHSYDVLIYALGAENHFFGLPPVAQSRVIPLKTLDDAKLIKTRLIELFENNIEPSVVVVGGGPTGVEAVAEIREYCTTLKNVFRRNSSWKENIYLVHAGERLLPQFHPRLGEHTETILKQRSIEVILGDSVVDVGDREVILKNGKRIPANCVVWAAGVRANVVPATPPLPVNGNGRIVVEKTLQLRDHSEVFVVGDAAAVDGVPMLAQAAVLMGEKAAENVIRYLEGKKLTSFYYHHKGDLFSLGQWLAGAEIFGFRFFGHFAWWLWRTIYLSKIIGVRNKIKVAVDWTFNLFSPRDINKY